MSLLWFFVLNVFWSDIWGKLFYLSVWFLIKSFLLRRLSLSLGCEGVFLTNLTSSSSSLIVAYFTVFITGSPSSLSFSSLIISSFFYAY